MLKYIKKLGGHRDKARRAWSPWVKPKSLARAYGTHILRCGARGSMRYRKILRKDKGNMEHVMKWVVWQIVLIQLNLNECNKYSGKGEVDKLIRKSTNVHKIRKKGRESG